MNATRASDRLARSLMLTGNRALLVEIAARIPSVACIFGSAITQHCADEAWRSIPGEEERYEVSSCGRVKTLLAPGGSLSVTPRLLKPQTASRSRLVTNLSGLTVYVHRIVASAFIGPRPDGLQINHINGDFRDNHARNLEYVTPCENVRHAYRLGLMRANRGEECRQATMSDAQAAEILASSEPGIALAQKFGVRPSVVSRVRTRQTWRHLQVKAEASAT